MSPKRFIVNILAVAALTLAIGCSLGETIYSNTDHYTPRFIPSGDKIVLLRSEMVRSLDGVLAFGVETYETIESRDWYLDMYHPDGTPDRSIYLGCYVEFDSRPENTASEHYFSDDDMSIVALNDTMVLFEDDYTTPGIHAFNFHTERYLPDDALPDESEDIYQSDETDSIAYTLEEDVTDFSISADSSHAVYMRRVSDAEPYDYRYEVVVKDLAGGKVKVICKDVEMEQ